MADNRKIGDSRSFKVIRSLAAFHGHCLMIGCGHGKEHAFTFLAKKIHSSRLHSPELFYHVSLSSDYSDEGKLDLEGDFLDEDVIHYLSQKKFDLICFEAVTEIFSSKESQAIALQHAKKLLKEHGICFIYFGGHDESTMNAAIEQFQYSYLFKYGVSNTWSLIASNHHFDLLSIMQTNPYLHYMGQHVLLKTSNFTLSYNYFEPVVGRILKTDQPDDVATLNQINPFVLFKEKALHETIEQLKSDDTKTNTKGYGSV